MFTVEKGKTLWEIKDNYQVLIGDGQTKEPGYMESKSQSLITRYL